MAKNRFKKEGNSSNHTFQVFTSNLAPIVRHDTMEGREYLVAPMVMMVEGVHQGSSGPLYYPADELAKIPEVWNHKPVVVYHPTENGQGISACSPEVLTNRKIGVIMNTKFEEGKLKSEAWLDVERVKEIDNRIWEAVENEEMMELSTGLFTDLQDSEGEWNGEAYTAVAINYRPDHLAVLPDQIGACSLADGAGFLRLNTDTNKLVIDLKSDWFKDNKQRLAHIIENELSFDDTRMLLYHKLDTTYPEGNAYIEAVYDEYFVFETNGGLKKQDYSIKDSQVTFNGIAQDVKKVVSYTTLSEIKTNVRKEKMMDKKQLVESIIANEKTLWKEDDREILMAMEETVLNKMVPVKNEEKEEEAPKEEVKVNEEEKKEAKVDNAKPQTLQEYIQSAPKEFQPILLNSLRQYDGEKKRLISAITANEKNPFTEDQLKAKDVEELRQIATLASTAKKEEDDPLNLSFLGQQDPVSNTASVEAMPLVTMNFEPEK
jgi:hypothetical protein